MKKILILGSGALSIGQGGEFDYSGTQAIKALKEEGITTILINPNIATYQTSEGVADIVYFLPVTSYFVEQVIAKEQPQGILLSFGGQTALNCGLELAAQGILEKYHVAVLGTSIQTIQDTEDRELFVKRLQEIQVSTAKSFAVSTVADACAAAHHIGYPVMLRAAFALGGKGSGVAHTENELCALAEKAFTSVQQVLIEEYLGGWKEIEYEVVRDCYGNCITVCNMENIDPMGIHTGESIVVAPSQTLTNQEYHLLRDIAIKVVRHLKIIGECNIQYALDPYSHDYRVIEVNARLSRSSALASKATGYPLAFVAAKLSLGYALHEITNSVTQVTKACFEPSLDYVVVKIPQWDLQKFVGVDTRIGTEMKSVGEVMAIGRKFEEALQKALRMLHQGMKGLVQNNIVFENLEQELRCPTDKRIFAIAQAMEQGMDIKTIHTLTSIDMFFLHKIQNIIQCQKNLCTAELDRENLTKAKQLGFSDEQIGLIMHQPAFAIRAHRKQLGVVPVVKQIDTLAGEFPCSLQYLYFTYNGTEHDVSAGSHSILVLGSGAYKIGSSVEFDWCCVQGIQRLKKNNMRTILLNYNPETVSTDYDICDVLYFDEISLERVLDIYEFEHPSGVVVSLGGQIPNTLALKLHAAGVPLFGTSAIDIDKAEDRHKFSLLLDALHIAQPEWSELTTLDDAKRFAERVGYPVLIRPSYVLSGAAMQVVFSEQELTAYLAQHISKEHPVVVTQFIQGAKEIEIDGIAKHGELLLWAITEHVENAGVHSGDATLVLPVQKLYQETLRKVKKATRAICHALHITGPFNIQFLAKQNEIKVIECNLRASRSLPFCSKVLKKDFVALAIDAMLGLPVQPQFVSSMELEYVGVKAPQFSFNRLKGADPALRVEMASTGEVACLGDDIEEAFLKAFLATGYTLPAKAILLSIGSLEEKVSFLKSAKLLERMNYALYATKGTALFLLSQGVSVTLLHWSDEHKESHVLTYLKKRAIDFVIDIPSQNPQNKQGKGYALRRTAIDFHIPLITNIQLAKLLVQALSKYTEKSLTIKSWQEYH
jgi:carbamoyl-phosphate synthase large subunit